MSQNTNETPEKLNQNINEGKDKLQSENKNEKNLENTVNAASEEKAAEPKKKRPAFVFRPQNSEAGKIGGRKPAGNKSAAAGAKKAPAKRAPKEEGKDAAPAEKKENAAKKLAKASAKNEGTAEAAKTAAKAPKAEAAKAKTENKAEAVKAEVPKSAAVKAEAPKAEAVKAEAPKAEAPRAEAPKAPEQPTKVLSAAEQAIAAARAAKEKREAEAARKLEEAQKIAAAFRAEVAARQAAEAEAKKKAAAEKPAQNNNRSEGRRGGQGGQNRDRGNFNRNGQGQNRGAQGGGRNGQGGQNQGGNRGTFNRGGQNGQGGFRGGQNAGRPGQGGFRGGQSAPRQDVMAAPVSSKGNDSRKYDNRKKDKARQDFGKDGRRQENTKNFEKNSRRNTPAPAPVEKKVDEIRTIELPDYISIKDLCDKMKVQPSAVIKAMFLKGEILTMNSEIDFDKAEAIAMDYNCICEHEVKVDVIAELLKDTEDAEETLVSRPPVVCVMGHVDHGKTSILDAIRQAHIADREAGGITQHIGAYVVDLDGRRITFLDTPGHEAFTAMRLRGAQSTDIAILVVAADDGVMPQTLEAISHAKAANVDVIVAINKIDKPGANIDRVKKELSEHGLVPEDWGGDTPCVPVSAHTKEGLDDLLEMVLLVSEVKELKANPDRLARGIVIEAELDRGRGPVATVLIQKGTLHVGDNIAAGSCYGKVRAMLDENGKRVKEAGPSVPVQVLGLNDVPNAGEIFVQTENDKDARSFAETFIATNREKMIENSRMSMTLESLMSQIQAGSLKQLNLIVKADVQGSVEAVKASLEKLSNEEVLVKVIHNGVGNINESDVTLAGASGAIIIGFNVKPDNTAKIISEQEKVDIRLYSVIYKAIEDIERAMKGMLDPIFEEKVIGHAVVRQIFKASGVGNIAGSYITDGIFQRGCSVRITREGSQIYDGPLASLKRFKDDVKEVREGYECGLVFEKFNDIQVDDTLEAYAMVEVPRT